MADTKISGMAAAAALTGAELTPLVQGGGNVRTTTAAIAALAAAAPQSVFVRNFAGTTPNVTPTVEASAFDKSNGSTWGWDGSTWTQFS